MTAVAKSLTTGVSLATTLPAHNHIIGPDLTAGESIGAGDACFINSDGYILRALESQANAAAAINDVQTLTSNGATGGTFTLTYGAGAGNVTGNIAYNASAATIAAALVALTTVGAGNITVSGAFPTWTITGASTFAGKELDAFGVDYALLQQNPPGPQPAQMLVTHTTVGEPAGTGVELAQSKVRGFAMIPVRRGQPISLYDAVMVGYSDQLLTPGQDLYLSSTVPGGLDTAATLTGQRPIAYAVDNTRVYFMCGGR